MFDCQGAYFYVGCAEELRRGLQKCPHRLFDYFAKIKYRVSYLSVFDSLDSVLRYFSFFDMQITRSIREMIYR